MVHGSCNGKAGRWGVSTPAVPICQAHPPHEAHTEYI